MKRLKLIIYLSIIILTVVCMSWVYLGLTKTLVPGSSILLLIIKFTQRSSAIIAYFTVIYIIVLDAYKKLSKEDVVIIKNKLEYFLFFLIILHPIMLLLQLGITKKALDPFYIYTDFCFFCETKEELYITLGRIGFIVLGAKFIDLVYRKINQVRFPFSYKLIYIIVFPLITIHAWKLGTIMHFPKVGFSPIPYLFFLGILIYTTVIAKKTIVYFRENFKIR